MKKILLAAVFSLAATSLSALSVRVPTTVITSSTLASSSAADVTTGMTMSSEEIIRFTMRIFISSNDLSGAT